MKKDGLGYLYLFNTVVLFSTYEVVSKTLVGKIDPLQTIFIRFFIGGLLLFMLLLFKRDLAIAWKDFLQLFLVGIINVAVSMSLLQLSIYSAGSQASVVAVVFSSNPIFVSVFAAWIDKEKIRMYKVLGLLAGILGIAVIFMDKLRLDFSQLQSPLLALASAVFYGLYTVLGRKLSIRVGSLKMNAYSFIAGSIMMIPLLLALRIPVIRFEASGIYQMIYLSFFVTGLAYFTYFKGLAVVGASSGSLVFFIKPVLASVIAIIFLKEQPGINLFTGTALIVAGIVIVIHGNKIKEKISSKFAGFYK